MGKPPAVIIIARHGARLDQADKQWHLTSPTPYDPPLTYGGWTQARALGARIAGILNAREDEHEQEGAGRSGNHTRGRPAAQQKHQVIIHSSPFTRCVQTSIAIGAGIAQFRGQAPPITDPAIVHRDLPHIQTAGNASRLATSSPAIPASVPSHSVHQPVLYSSPPDLPPVQKNRSAELRLDAFLGEWLSADYFEDIAAPPSSTTMVATARAELLRPGELIAGSSHANSPDGNFPGGWRRNWSLTSPVDQSTENPGLANMARMAQALPGRFRSSTHGSDVPTSASLSRNPIAPKLHQRDTTSDPASTVHADLATYMPPIPNYAISPSSPIPVGYVAHARDACIAIAYGWHSMAPPLCWGDGGEYGEEWSSMHVRFRTGLAKMVEWYEEHGPAPHQATEEPAKEEAPVEEGGEEEESDTVLILVTHGAGCNALLGALTNQPVLLNVGMASLTMAVRKKNAKPTVKGNEEGGTEEQGKGGGRRGAGDAGIAGDYEIKYMASTDHLRANSTPPSPSSASAGGAGSHSPALRRSTTSTSTDNFGPDDSVPTGLHRSMSGHSALRSAGYASSIRGSGAKPRISSGLWRQSMGDSTNGDGSESTPSTRVENPGTNGLEEKDKENVDGVRKTDRQANQQATQQANGADGGNDRADRVTKARPSQTDMATPDVSDPPPSPITLPIRTSSHKGLWGGGGGGGGGGHGKGDQNGANASAG